MERVSFFLTEYSGWMVVTFGVLVTMLLAVTLRKIKKLGKRMDTLARSIRYGRETWVDMEEATSLKMVTGEKEADLGRIDKKRTEGEKSLGQQRAMKEASVEEEREMEPDELLNAVLDEVFP